MIEPVIAQLRAAGTGLRARCRPTPPSRRTCSPTPTSCVAMYHDQGLPVLKYAGFGNAVNMTLGLPILRTSVDHGTALALARTGKADAGSLRAALALAIAARRRQRRAMPVRKRFGQHFLHDPGSSAASSMRSRRGPASAWSRSARAAAR